MSRTLIANTQPPMFHPSIFETTTADTPGGTGIIKDLERERTKRLATDDLNNLQSPGSFSLTDKLNDKISGSNTKYMTKTLFEESLLSFLYFSKLV